MGSVQEGGVPGEEGTARTVLDYLFRARVCYIPEAIRDRMKLHVGFCQWARDDGVTLPSLLSPRQERAAVGWCRPLSKPHSVLWGLNSPQSPSPAGNRPQSGGFFRCSRMGNRPDLTRVDFQMQVDFGLDTESRAG